MMSNRVWAILIKQSLMSLTVIFIAGVLWDHSFNEPSSREPLFAGAIAVAIYIAIAAIMGLLNVITGAIYLWLFAEKDLSEAVLDDLRAMKLPAPRSYDAKNYDYLATLADDESVEASDRVKAAALYGTYKGNMRGLFRSLALRKAINAAVLRYYQEAPRRE